MCNVKVCPVCFSNETQGEDLHFVDNDYLQMGAYFYCNACGASWRATYDLCAISNIHNGDGNEVNIIDENSNPCHEVKLEKPKTFFVLEDDLIEEKEDGNKHIFGWASNDITDNSGTV